MSMFIDFLVAGLAMGSIYALLGVGLSLFRSTTYLINFAQGASDRTWSPRPVDGVL